MSSLKHFFVRVIVTVLFLAVPILGVWTFMKADEWGLWFPPVHSSYGGAIDNLFNLILWMVAVTFIGTELLLVWFFFRYSKKDATRSVYSHGNHTLEMVWTAIPALLLIIVAFSQMGTWASVKINFPTDGPYTAAK